MDYKFKTSQQWKHQVIPEEDGFYWDSNFYDYKKVFACRGVPVQKNVNFAHWEHLDEFFFDIYLVDGSILEQEVKSLQRIKSTAFLGNTSDAKKELSYLFDILIYKTFEIRYEKYQNYFERYKRYLLHDDNKGNTVSADRSGNIFKNENFFGSWFPSKNDLDVTQDNRDRSIRFRKKSSTFLSKDRDCYVDIFIDYDIVSQHMDFIGLGLDKFTEDV